MGIEEEHSQESAQYSYHSSPGRESCSTFHTFQHSSVTLGEQVNVCAVGIYSLTFIFVITFPLFFYLL